ncbi:MAG: thioredoxin family protein, partial [Bacteroidales bacterium]|nr:thioredoxin family protein [Bacteroidales bacterium]
MKKYLVMMLLCALAGCVGQKEDPEDEPGTPGEEITRSGAGIVLDFTATWCVNCPRMTTAIEEAGAAGTFIPICVH